MVALHNLMADTPHFAFPFHLQGKSFAVNEQDSYDDIVACVVAVLLYRPGDREMLPDFGVPDPTFLEQPIDTTEIRDAIARWEPRAVTEIDVRSGEFDRLVENVFIKTSSQETSDT